ncbi:2Fe-2S iron-sulfur cluster-binding protein [Leptolyngbya ohadii]|uniref:2Fe-2S iron-sulfur cluster-binding protein n=1 Tax=Leptolyngbya ohadii TaxID=1962290 RepID=UPI000B59ECDC|nr:2Fe-2S iron-sulfur cluster-binding protein [Leptolyngbya ohadii]
MPRITAAGKTFECDQGANLRQVLLKNGVALHNGQSKIVNCKGIGTCGTCAVQIEGEVSEPQWRENARRSLPPHSLEKDRRLACQTCVLADVTITKFDGFWGQGDRMVW